MSERLYFLPNTIKLNSLTGWNQRYGGVGRHARQVVTCWLSCLYIRFNNEKNIKRVWKIEI